MKKIFLGPEGKGKSTGVIRSMLDDFNKSNTIRIFSSHTIDNSIEKFEYSKNYKPELESKIHRISSDSELFRNMISEKDEYIASLFNTSKLLINNYISYSLISHNPKTNEYHQINKNIGDIKRLETSLKYSDSPEDYNASVTQLIYNTLNNVAGKLDYYLSVHISEDKPNINNMLPNFENQLKEHGNNVLTLNYMLEDKNIRTVCIPGSYLAKYKFNRKERDQHIKHYIAKNNNCLLFAQSKTVENIIIPQLKTHNKIDDCLFIMDEILDSDFILDNFNVTKKIGIIIRKIINKGFDSINNKDTLLLKDLNLYDKIKKKCKDNIESLELKLDNIKLLVDELGASTFIGEPRFCKRLTEFKNIYVLTSERFKSELLSNSLQFEIVEDDKHYMYSDDNFDLYMTSKDSPFQIKKAHAEQVKCMVELIREEQNSRDETLVLGTSYFGTDMSLASCRGRNIDPKVKKLVIVTNQNSPNIVSKYVAFVKKFYKNKPKSMRNYVALNLRIDELNQAIARVSGYRREIFKNTKIELYYNSKDTHTINALKKIRYMGHYKTFEKGNTFFESDIVNSFTFRWNRLIGRMGHISYKYDKLNEFFKITSDKDYIHNTKGMPGVYTLDNLKNKFGYTKTGIVNLVIPAVFNHIKQNIGFSKSLQILSTNRYKDDFVDDRETFYSHPNRCINVQHNVTTTNSINSSIINACESLIEGEVNVLCNLPKNKNIDTKLFFIANFYHTFFETYQKSNGKYSFEYTNLKGNPNLVYHYMHVLSTMDDMVNSKTRMGEPNKEINYVKEDMIINLKKYGYYNLDNKTDVKDISNQDRKRLKLMCICEYMWTHDRNNLLNHMYKNNMINETERIAIQKWINTVNGHKIYPGIATKIIPIVFENFSTHKVTMFRIKKWVGDSLHISCHIQHKTGNNSKTVKNLNVVQYNPISMYRDILSGKIHTLTDTILNKYKEIENKDFAKIHALLRENYDKLIKGCGLDPNEYYLFKETPKPSVTKAILDFVNVTSTVPIVNNGMGHLVKYMKSKPLTSKTTSHLQHPESLITRQGNKTLITNSNNNFT